MIVYLIFNDENMFEGQIFSTRKKAEKWIARVSGISNMLGYPGYSIKSFTVE